jgi:hypothetical protein
VIKEGACTQPFRGLQKTCPDSSLTSTLPHRYTDGKTAANQWHDPMQPISTPAGIDGLETEYFGISSPTMLHSSRGNKHDCHFYDASQPLIAERVDY